jgi:hypothetical protein
VDIFTFIIIVGLNINQTVIYFKLNGQPYKSTEHFEKCRHVGIVCAIWTLSFVFKEVSVFYGASIYKLKSNVDFVSALSIALVDFFTIIVPFYCVIN